MSEAEQIDKDCLDVSVLKVEAKLRPEGTWTVTATYLMKEGQTDRVHVVSSRSIVGALRSIVEELKRRIDGTDAS